MKKKILSFLIPSRGRFEILKHTLNNLSDVFSENLQDVEVVVKLDTDDIDSHRILDEKFGIDIKYTISDRLNGYLSLSDFMSECLKLSDSYFVILYNDDATIKNHHNLIQNLKGVKDVISISTERPTSHFPIIHYKIFEITGGFNKEVVYFDGHYDNVKFALPKENQFDFNIEFLHHEQWDLDIYTRKNIESQKYHIHLGERYYVDKDSNTVRAYFSQQNS
jgi:hypothetical protein